MRVEYREVPYGSTAIPETFRNSNTCKVSNKNVGDIFPIYFYDNVVEPATNAAAAALLDQ